MTRTIGLCRAALAGTVLASVALWAAACAPSDRGAPPADREREPASAPLAIGVGDLIVGRTLLADRLLLLTQSRQLIELWPVSGVATRRAVLGIGPLEQVRGLARLDDGTLWTLVGRQEFVEITGHRAGRRVRLPGPVVALYGAGDRLAYQSVDFDPPAPALLARTPDDPAPQVWGPLLTRLFGRSRAEDMVLNLVVCGLGNRRLVPCWFAVGDELSIVSVAGGGNTIRLAGVRTIDPDDLLFGDVSLRPRRDVYARAADDLWVLGADVLDESRKQSSPRWEIVQFDGLGQARQVKILEKACRMFLAMTSKTAWLLANDGSIVRVDL